MRYLTWKLNWDDPSHGTGPEGAISQQGGYAEASSFANPSVETGTILGYLKEGDIDLSSLTPWQVAELTQAAALEFAQAVEASAYLLPDGFIATAVEPNP
jgi:hypothetical protein